MYVIREGLHKRWRFLAYLFAAAGLVGCLPAFQANQLTQILRDVVFIDSGWLEAGEEQWRFNLTVGVLLGIGAGVVILGGLNRIARGRCRPSALHDGSVLGRCLDRVGAQHRQGAGGGGPDSAGRFHRRSRRRRRPADDDPLWRAARRLLQRSRHGHRSHGPRGRPHSGAHPRRLSGHAGGRSSTPCWSARPRRSSSSPPASGSPVATSAASRSRRTPSPPCWGRPGRSWWCCRCCASG